MIQNNNLNVLPFYRDVADQDHRKRWVYTAKVPLISTRGKFLPFQIRRNHADAVAQPITLVQLFDCNDNFLLDVTTEALAAGLFIKEFIIDGYDLIINPSFNILTVSIPQGTYYLKISDGPNTYFSELFTMFNFVDNFVKITYFRNGDNIRDLHTNEIVQYYEEGHKNYMYLPTDIAKPEYPYSETGKERDGLFTPYVMISRKQLGLSIFAPEFLADVLRILPMHDSVTFFYDGKSYPARRIIVQGDEWAEQGNLLKMDISFLTDNGIKVTAKSKIKNIGNYGPDYGPDYDKN